MRFMASWNVKAAEIPGSFIASDWLIELKMNAAFFGDVVDRELHSGERLRRRSSPFPFSTNSSVRVAASRIELIGPGTTSSRLAAIEATRVVELGHGDCPARTCPGPRSVRAGQWDGNPDLDIASSARSRLIQTAEAAIAVPAPAVASRRRRESDPGLTAFLVMDFFLPLNILSLYLRRRARLDSPQRRSG